MEEREMENGLKDLPIGSKFEWCKLVFKVKERYPCKGCYFLNADYGCAACVGENHIPVCDAFSRKDDKDVIFVKVGEVQD